jgi:GNAT superfamily N-acetyltransferase
MIEADLPKVFYLANSYWENQYFESLESFADKLDFYPSGCWVYDPGTVGGYLFFYPGSSDSYPKLNDVIDRQVKTNCQFIHDIVLRSELRGQGIARDILKKILTPSETFVLVAANQDADKIKFWSKWRFKLAGELVSTGSIMKREKGAQYASSIFS